MMKAMTIEALLWWAFNEELPKVGGGGGPSGVSGTAWSMVSDMAALGTLIDAQPNQWGVMADFSTDAAPHADAMTIADAVFRLDSSQIDVPEGWEPFPDWDDPHGLVDHGVREAIARWHARPADSRLSHVRALVVRQAVLKRRPAWECGEQPKARLVMRGGKPAWFVRQTVKDRFGKAHVVEEQGYDPKTHRPKKGAYRKHVLSRPIYADVLTRLDWQLWVSALETVRGDVAARLREHRVEPMAIHRSPWRRKAGA